MMLSKTSRDAVKWALEQIGELEANDVKQNNNVYPDEFEWLWKSYPERNGGKGDKRKALHCCQARMKDGETWKTLAQYMKAYEAHCKREGKLGTSYVLQFVTFFGPGERYKDDYSEKKAPTKDGKSAFTKLIEQANSGETVTHAYIAPDGKEYASPIEYYKAKGKV